MSGYTPFISQMIISEILRTWGGVEKKNTLPETNSLHLKMNGLEY